MSKKSKKSKKTKDAEVLETQTKELDFEGVEFTEASLEEESVAFAASVSETDALEEGDPLLLLSDDSVLAAEADDADGSSSSDDLLDPAFEEVLPNEDESETFDLEASEEDEEAPLVAIGEDGQALEVQQLTDDEAVSVIESLLFISDRPVGMTVFKNAFVGTDVTTKKIKALIAELQADLAQTRRGVSLEEVDGAFQLRTKVDNQEYIKKIIKARTFRLTGPSLETLAVIAYKQPCIKSDVDEVRGVESGHLVRALMDKGLVAFAGKSDLPGKPMFYKTTRKFLEIFGLRNINELPTLKEMEELLPEGIGAEEEKETLSDLTGKLSEQYEGNYSVAEDELGKITEQLAGITTNTEFFEEEKRKQKEKQERDKAEALQEAVALGDEVDPKDLKWLERYEAKMAAALEADEVAASDSDSVETSTVSEILTADESSSDSLDFIEEEVNADSIEDSEEGFAFAAETDVDESGVENQTEEVSATEASDYDEFMALAEDAVPASQSEQQEEVMPEGEEQDPLDLL